MEAPEDRQNDGLTIHYRRESDIQARHALAARRVVIHIDHVYLNKPDGKMFPIADSDRAAALAFHVNAHDDVGFLLEALRGARLKHDEARKMYGDRMDENTKLREALKITQDKLRAANKRLRNRRRRA